LTQKPWLSCHHVDASMFQARVAEVIY